MRKLVSLAVLLFLTVNCTEELKDSIDVNSIENPNIYQEDIIGQPNSSINWLQGLERQLSVTLNELVLLAELSSDNYRNTFGFYNISMDGLNISTVDPDIEQAQFEIARLREAAMFGLKEIGPNDMNYSASTTAEYHFFQGLSYLFAGMYFSYLPAEPLGAPLSSAENYNRAIASFSTAISINQLPSYYLARARAYYYLGNIFNATSDANSALGMNPKFLRAARYDQINGLPNRMEQAIFTRATNDLQPLASLDFLDPKYAADSSGEAPSIYFLKAEEAHLILAEADFALGNLVGVKQHLQALLNLVSDQSRTVKTLDDSKDVKSYFSFDGQKADNQTVTVFFKSGIILDRTAGPVAIPSVSGTSLTQTEIDNLDLSDFSLLALYTTRQEIFIAEGLRSVDMGIKWVISESEILQNKNINTGDPGTKLTIPAFLVPEVPFIDDQVYDVPFNDIFTSDLNYLLAIYKNSNAVLPFH